MAIGLHNPAKHYSAWHSQRIKNAKQRPTLKLKTYSLGGHETQRRIHSSHHSPSPLCSHSSSCQHKESQELWELWDSANPPTFPIWPQLLPGRQDCGNTKQKPSNVSRSANTHNWHPSTYWSFHLNELHRFFADRKRTKGDTQHTYM
jgi:hypothetical protein